MECEARTAAETARFGDTVFAATPAYEAVESEPGVFDAEIPASWRAGLGEKFWHLYSLGEEEYDEEYEDDETDAADEDRVDQSPPTFSPGPFPLYHPSRQFFAAAVASVAILIVCTVVMWAAHDPIMEPICWVLTGVTMALLFASIVTKPLGSTHIHH